MPRFQGMVGTRLAGLLALVLAGCAAPTPSAYGPLDGRYGFAERQTEDGAWRVSFTANRITPRETVESYALLRAAEIALKAGFPRFAVMDRVYDVHTDRTYAYNLNPPGIEPFEHRFRGSTYGDPFSNNQLLTSEWRTAVLVIKPYRDGVPPGAQRSYDAQETIARLGPAVTRR